MAQFWQPRHEILGDILKIEDNHQRAHAFHKQLPFLKPGEKLVIFGANGQIGKKLRKYLTESKLYEGQILYCDHFLDDNFDRGKPGWRSAEEKFQASGCDKDIDITNRQATKNYLVENNAKAVINLAALLSGAAALDPVNADRINSRAAAQLLDIAKEIQVERRLAKAKEAGKAPKEVDEDPMTVMTMSSMATQEFDTTPSMSPDEVAARDEWRPKMTQSPAFPGKGLYALQKQGVEAEHNKYSIHFGVNTIVPCLAGVMNADTDRIADGTTEQIDELVVNCARQKVYAEFGILDECPGLIKGYYIPAVKKDCSFAMVDSKTLVESIFMLLHQDLLPHQEQHHNGVVHNVYEYTIGMGEVENILKKCNPDFKVQWANEYPKSDEPWKPGKLDPGKVARSEAWALGMKTDSTEKLIGKFKQFDKEASIINAFTRAVEETRAQLKERHPDSIPSSLSKSHLNGVAPRNGFVTDGLQILGKGPEGIRATTTLSAHKGP